MTKEHGVIIAGKATTDWFPNFTTAMNYAEREHAATGVRVLVVDDEFAPVTILRANEPA